MPVVDTLDSAIDQRLVGVVQLMDRANGSLLGPSSELRLRFTTGLKEGSISLGGELGVAGSMKVSARSGGGVTEILVSPPEAGWDLGATQELTVDGNTGSRAIRRTTLQFDVVASVLHVSAERGGFTGTGTIDRPYNSIERAIEVAEAEFRDGAEIEIRLSGGTYAFAMAGSASAEGIIVPAGYEIVGGYSDDFSTLAPENYPTTLRSESIENHTSVTLKSATLKNATIETIRNAPALPLRMEGTSVLHNVVIEHDSGAAVIVRDGGISDITDSHFSSAADGGVIDVRDAGVIVSDSQVVALPTGSGATAVDVSNGAVEFRRSNIFTSGEEVTSGARATSSTLNFFDTTLRLGAGGKTMYGIRSLGTSLLVVRSSIALGEGDSNIGIEAEDSDVHIVNSTIDAGNSMRAGVQVYDGEITIRTSTIGADTDAFSALVDIRTLDQSSVSTTLQNVILHLRGNAGGYVLETDSPGATNLEHAVLHAPGADALVRAPSGGVWTNYSTIAGGETAITGEGGTASGNLDVDPVFAEPGPLYGGADWHLSAGSPASVTEGGIDGSARDWNVAYDADGNDRTVPWSIGAYEYD